MESSTTTSYSVVSELEGTLLKTPKPFAYFMLMAFEASGLIRYTLLLFLWPIIALLDVLGYRNGSLKLMIFVATAGLRESEIESVSRAVLPKFYMDDISMDAWRAFGSCEKRVVVTRMPRVMVERFAKDHLRAHEVIGTEIIINRFGYATGFIQESDVDRSIFNSVANLFEDRRPQLGLGRPIISLSNFPIEQVHAPVPSNYNVQRLHVQLLPVIFHDGRLVKLPTPATALLILLWIPLGIVLAVVRLFVGSMLPLWAIPYVSRIFNIRFTVKGKPPAGNLGVLFIVPVAMNYRVGFFHATTARGWKAFDPIFFFMNPRPVYEVTFLNQLEVEATCSSGKSPYDVANYVQRILAATLGFECTNFTRKDKYRVLAGNDDSASLPTSPAAIRFVQHIADCPSLFPEILKTLFEIVLFEDCGNQWSLSRPILSLILISEQIFPDLKAKILPSQPVDQHQRLSACFESLMADISRGLDPKNREKFSQNLNRFRLEFRVK
ncbi:hypothetical protein Bca52824_070052 [Brassica carinata]|uniref:Glycerol-3-phosphate acyltransferase RAM2/GPAT1-8 HAD-like domain-containing protein n=1 Tax=Brassica carinata TaxID=52824 RepID=A0A8X7Q4P2_BRACI|nr:hypothetical protein Bca52824_070052 [Brassica carinata]